MCFVVVFACCNSLQLQEKRKNGWGIVKKTKPRKKGNPTRLAIYIYIWDSWQWGSISYDNNVFEHSRHLFSYVIDCVVLSDKNFGKSRSLQNKMRYELNAKYITYELFICWICILSSFALWVLLFLATILYHRGQPGGRPRGQLVNVKFSQILHWGGHPEGHLAGHLMGQHSTAMHSKLLKGARHPQFGETFVIFSIWYRFDETIRAQKKGAFSPNLNLVMDLVQCWRWPWFIKFKWPLYSFLEI